ncbi:hypothetical protein ACFX1Z_028882 [Malus domestica]
MSENATMPEATVLFTTNSRSPQGPRLQNINSSTADRFRNRPTMQCTKCGLKNHTIQGCYEIISYLEGWVHKGRKKESSRASFTTYESSQDVSSSDHVPKALNTSSISNSTSANTCHRSWIIDIGATNHMTSDANILHSLKTANQTFITSANGSISPITGEGSLSLTSSFNLDHVLGVPSLDYDLLSVS